MVKRKNNDFGFKYLPFDLNGKSGKDHQMATGNADQFRGEVRLADKAAQGMYKHLEIKGLRRNRSWNENLEDWP